MEQAKRIVELIKSSEKIVITSHRSPDGDSIGSSLGMYWFIRNLGKDVQICHPDPCPEFLNWAKGDVKIVDFENDETLVKQLMSEADLIFCLDYNGANRLGNDMGEVLTAAKGTKVMIDHHPYPEDFVDIAISMPEVCSTAQLVYELIDTSGNKGLLDAKIGTPLYLGIMTDTGSFRYPSVQSRTHEILASFLAVGVNHSEIHERVFDDNRIEKLKLRAHIIAENLELMEEYKVAIISVTEHELHRFHYIKGDTEGLVNVALSVEGVQAAVFFTAMDDVVKISFRSKGDKYVNEIARDHFEGGGHKYAAGGVSTLDLESTIRKFKELVPKYF